MRDSAYCKQKPGYHERQLLHTEFYISKYEQISCQAGFLFKVQRNLLSAQQGGFEMLPLVAQFVKQEYLKATGTQPHSTACFLNEMWGTYVDSHVIIYIQFLPSLTYQPYLHSDVSAPKKRTGKNSLACFYSFEPIINISSGAQTVLLGYSYSNDSRKRGECRVQTNYY